MEQQYSRKNKKWTNEAVIKALIDSSKTKLLDNPEEKYEKNLISSPVTFANWKVKIYLDYVMFSGYNSFCKLVFTKVDTDPVTNFPTLKISYADWTSAVAFNQSDVEGVKANLAEQWNLLQVLKILKFF